MHVHVCHSAEHGPPIQERYWESFVAMTLNAQKNLQRALNAGITTVRDLGAEINFILQLRHEYEKGRLLGPRLFVAGHMITAIGGHGMEYGQNMGYEVCGADGVRKAVRQHIARKVDVIKLVTSSGGTKTELTLEELRAGVEEAHWSGVKVACHAAYKRRSIVNAVIAGCDTLEHGCVIDEEIADLMSANNTTYCPTLGIVRTRLVDTQGFGVKSVEYTKAERAVEDHARGFKLVFERKLPIIAGTDAGWRGMSFDALHNELSLMCDLGMSCGEALKTVTINAAKALDKEDLVGRVRSGMYADILLLQSNPIFNINALRDPFEVIANGQIVKGSLQRRAT